MCIRDSIGPAYDRALRNTGEPEAANEATRRAMELLKRACMDGVEPTKALVLRITDDCCNEKAFFNRQVEVERQKLQEGDGAEAAPEPAPKGKALLGGKRFQEAAEKPAESHIKAVSYTHLGLYPGDPGYGRLPGKAGGDPGPLSP